MRESIRENTRLIIEVVGLVALCYSLKLTRDSVRQAEAAATLAGEGLALSRKMAEADARPVLIADELWLDQFAMKRDGNREVALFRISLRNISDSPAFQVIVTGVGSKGKGESPFIAQGGSQEFNLSFEIEHRDDSARGIKPDIQTFSVQFHDVYGNSYLTTYQGTFYAKGKKGTATPLTHRLIPAGIIRGQ
jgi:hypothetical protein